MAGGVLCEDADCERFVASWARGELVGLVGRIAAPVALLFAGVWLLAVVAQVALREGIQSRRTRVREGRRC